MPRTGRPPKPIEERFWEKVDIRGEDECWIWKGGKHPYGNLFARTGYHIPAHQFSWELYNKQEVPDGCFVCHTCDNPPCVNYNHLFLGTPLDNMRDKISKGRDRYNPCIGERNGKHKLTDQDVRDIREKRDDGLSCISLGKEYGVGRGTIYRIVVGNRRRHVH